MNLADGYYWVKLNDKPEVVEILDDCLYRTGSDVTCFNVDGRWTEFGEPMDIEFLTDVLMPPHFSRLRAHMGDMPSGAYAVWDGSKFTLHHGSEAVVEEILRRLYAHITEQQVIVVTELSDTERTVAIKECIGIVESVKEKLI